MAILSIIKIKNKCNGERLTPARFRRKCNTIILLPWINNKNNLPYTSSNYLETKETMIMDKFSLQLKHRRGLNFLNDVISG